MITFFGSTILIISAIMAYAACKTDKELTVMLEMYILAIAGGFIVAVTFTAFLLVDVVLIVLACAFLRKTLYRSV